MEKRKEKIGRRDSFLFKLSERCRGEAGCIWVHRLLRFAKCIWPFSQYFHVALATIKFAFN